MQNHELVATIFVNKVFLVVLENTHAILILTPPIRNNLPFHRRTTLITTTPIYCISEEASPSLLVITPFP